MDVDSSLVHPLTPLQPALLLTVGHRTGTLSSDAEDSVTRREVALRVTLQLSGSLTPPDEEGRVSNVVDELGNLVGREGDFRAENAVDDGEDGLLDVDLADVGDLHGAVIVVLDEPSGDVHLTLGRAPGRSGVGAHGARDEDDLPVVVGRVLAVDSAGDDVVAGSKRREDGLVGLDISSLVERVVELDRLEADEAGIPCDVDTVSCEFHQKPHEVNSHSRRAAPLRMVPSTCSVVTPSMSASPLTMGKSPPSLFFIQILDCDWFCTTFQSFWSIARMLLNSFCAFWSSAYVAESSFAPTCTGRPAAVAVDDWERAERAERLDETESRRRRMGATSPFC